MEISDELREHILSELERYQPILDGMILIESERKYVTFPIFLDGVVDQIRYNVAEQRFDQLRVLVATEGIVTTDLLESDYACFCRNFEAVVIPLPVRP